MAVQEFRDDDDGYLAWLAGHADGYVINVLRSPSPNGVRVHHASCRTINGQIPREGTWTGRYVKVCAPHLAEIDQWALDRLGGPIVRCGICHPASHAVQRISGKHNENGVTAAVSDGHYLIHGPTSDSTAVEVWTDDYIRFERRPPWQEHVRNEIRSRCTQLAPSAGQVLHAEFCGSKLPNADVENLVLYNIDTFRIAGRNGIQFEHGVTVPRLPMVLSIGSTTATRSRNGRMPSLIGGKGEHWPRLTGPPRDP